MASPNICALECQNTYSPAIYRHLNYSAIIKGKKDQSKLPSYLGIDPKIMVHL
jgi:hypothetical protein